MSKANKERFSVSVDPSLYHRARWVVAQGEGVQTMAALVSDGLGLAIRQLERRRRRPFRVRRRVKLKSGRPRKAA